MIIKLISTILFLSLFGCGTHSHQAQVNKYAYIQIIGEINEEKMVLDNGLPIILGDSTESFDLNGKTATKIRVQQGRHRITIYRKGGIIVDRLFYVSPGNVFEVELP